MVKRESHSKERVSRHQVYLGDEDNPFIGK
jgi:hypothetical protein